jgi:hypothetical protein
LGSGGPDTADLIRLATPGIEAAKDVKQGIQSLILPTAKSPEHLRAGEVLGSKLGTLHRMGEIAAKDLGKDSRMFDKLGVHNKDIPLNENPGIIFMSDMSQGRTMSPEMQLIANKVKRGFETRLRQLEQAGAPLEKIRENYFPGMWKDKTAALAFLSKRPFKGSESFRKQKVFDDIMEGIDAGLEPISNNPLDLVRLKYAELDRSIMANRALREWESSGDVISVNNSGVPLKKSLRENFNPEEWAKIDDKYGTIWIKDDFTGLPSKVGYRVAKKSVADVLNNYLSSSLYNSPYFGKAYKGYMAVGNTLNQAQLGVFSAFHAGFTGIETQVSANANIIKDVYGVARGNRTINQLVGTVKNAPIAIGKSLYDGSKVLAEWNNPQVDVPTNIPVSELPVGKEAKIALIAKAIEIAGGGLKMEQGLRTFQTEAMIRDWFGSSKMKAVARSPIALTELSMKPVMEWLVPRQKAGVFTELAGRIFEQNPDKTLEQLRPELRQAWNRVDARLGQVRYDRLFIRNTAKNFIQGIMRAPGWTGGTLAEVGGSVKDTVKFIKEWKETGKAPKDIPDRVAYTISLLGTMALTNAVLTVAFTGEKPEGMDYWAFRTGGEDDEGRPNRFLLPSYVKDMFAWARSPSHTLSAKVHPLLSLASDLHRNIDYYNTLIRNKDDSILKQGQDMGEYTLKQFEPFWIRGARKISDHEGGPEKYIAPYIGVMPAPKAYISTKADKEMDEYTNKFSITKTKEEFELKKVKNKVVGLIRKGNMDEAMNIVADVFVKNNLNPKIFDQWMKDVSLPTNVKRFKKLPLEWQIKTLIKANDKEKDFMLPFFMEKMDKTDAHIIDKNIDGINKVFEGIK